MSNRSTDHSVPEPVSFITVERGDDLIVAFAIQLGHPGDIASLILLRTPMYEGFLPEEERGVSVSYELFPERDDERLLEAHVSDDRAEIVSTERTYTLDLSRVERSELRATRAVLKRMNFDERFELRLAKRGR